MKTLGEKLGEYEERLKSLSQRLDRINKHGEKFLKSLDDAILKLKPMDKLTQTNNP